MKRAHIRNFRRVVPVLALLALAACAERAVPPAPVTITPEPPAVSSEQPYFTQAGVASWYGGRHHGRRTANGERFDMNAMTAAHRTLQLGTVVRVTNTENGRATTVRINDRGPYIRGRIIDLSAGVARLLGMKEDGVAQVRVEAYADDQTPEIRAAAGQAPATPGDLPQ